MALEDLRVDVRASIGVAFYPDHGGDPAALLRRAEVAMYFAKERRLGVAFYDPSQDRHSVQRLSLAGDLRRAVEAGASTSPSSPSSTSPAAACARSRPCCAGTIRGSARWRRRSSSPSPSRPG